MESPPARNEFQIGWICALPIEAAAAIQMLDENFGILQEQERTDTNTYTLGRIGHHHVVIACLPDGQYGTTSATTVANNMLRTFSDSLRIGLMVGIGGGAPSVEHDIRLGDIVISRPEGSHGGVIQYDMGKIGKNGIFQRIGSLNSPPKPLLDALAQMRAAELYDDPQYPVYLQEAIGKNKRTQKTFYRPNVRSDRLFKIDYGHSEGVTCCDQCPAEWEEDRITREDGNPQTHYGTIASGNTLIKDGKIREAIRKDTGALCFEMEAAGLMADFPCLVVRGICDYADSHKNKQWQGYAALAAAAFTKELLGYVPKGVSQERLVADICPLLEDIKEGQRKAFDQRECHHREKMERALTENQRRCHQAFKTSTYEQYKDINPNRVKGTCEWVLKSSEYRRWWESSSNDLLWISADPGCGKSVLAKSLIDEVFHASTPTVSICYFFFKDNDEQNSLATALCAILHQLFGLQPHLLRYALPFWEKNREKIHQGVEDLWHIFMAAMSDPESVDTICVFDALDECRRSDQKQLIGKLQQYYTKHRLSPPRSSLKFLVTSRPYDEIEEDFQSIIELFPQIHLRGEEENDQIHDEISLVVKIRVSELGKQLKLKATTEARLEKVLLEMEHRTYLWLYLAIDDIRTMFKDSLRPDQESVPLIPKSVNEAYRKILDRVTPRQEATVKTILRIIVGARRPLTIMEMAMALGVATSKSARTVVEAKVDLEGLGEKIRRLCGLFVFINDSKIYLIHQTAREFLITNIDGTTRHKWHFLLIDIEKEMVEICARYLLMDDLTDREWQENVHGLLVYSAQHWPDHFREISSLKAELFELVYRLYDVNTERFALWFPVFWQSAMPFEEKPQMNELHLAAFNGHHSVIRRLAMSDEQAIDRPDTSGMNALQWASLRGHHKCVRLLLEKGAYVNAQGGKYGNALYAASLNGHVNIVQQLLEKRADVSAQCGLFGNALQAASFEGHIKIVQQLLTNGANVNAQGGVYGNALQATSFGGHIDIVQQLLLEGADVNAQGGFYGSTLQMASFKGYVDIVQLLLEKGVDVNAQGGDYGNSLQAASSGGHIDIVRKLLTNGANVNAQGGQFGNALQAASWRGHIDIVQQLLLEGADVNARGRSYPMIDGQSYPMIHRPVRRRPNHALQEYEMQLTLLGQQNKRRLMMAGQEQWLSDQRALGNSNALYAASAQGHVEIVRILLEKGAYVNAQGKYGNALYAASAQGHVEIVRILLEKGAYVNAQGGKYGNALYAASLKGHVDIVQVLQKYVSAKQKAQQTNTSHRRTRRIIDNPVQPKRRRIRN
ncbi:Ankyrin repeat domain-containing protein 50 [Talaromyces pinophilus]|nr:Ankyrin repeat domain-containing protein 50 [Talaromyces pinophilus]